MIYDVNVPYAVCDLRVAVAVSKLICPRHNGIVYFLIILLFSTCLLHCSGTLETQDFFIDRYRNHHTFLARNQY